MYIYGVSSFVIIKKIIYPIQFIHIEEERDSDSERERESEWEREREREREREQLETEYMNILLHLLKLCSHEYH